MTYYHKAEHNMNDQHEYLGHDQFDAYDFQEPGP